MVISKPLEIKLFENEINTFLEKQKIASFYEVDKKYIVDLDKIHNSKLAVESTFKAAWDLNEKYYQEYMCECNGTCGTGIRGRGIECKIREERYKIFSEELVLKRKRKDALLRDLSAKESQLEEIISREQNVIQTIENIGFFDRVRALSIVGDSASVFILLLFVMIETAPILTKLLSSKGPYDNLLLQSEYEYETNFLKAVGFQDLERGRYKNINKISAEIELEAKESEIKNDLKQKALDRYDRMRQGIDSV